ncbi:hypothetical protein MTR67_037262 [Solanum verrucosum]|uniref:Uncharacterized protein n=1 Tax=Solanum verrucosum TaxID=315347 RepID=A0AAF0ZLU5_SOLVR|nr:hypothetical protein MTR67_037262 [Solanum verrucosum]
MITLKEEQEQCYNALCKSYSVITTFQQFSKAPLLFSGSYVSTSVLAPVFGLRLNPQAAARSEKILIASLAKIESVWLQKKGRFLLGSGQPSIADLSLACEIMSLEVMRFSLFFLCCFTIL